MTGQNGAGSAAPPEKGEADDLATLAKGGRTNFFGFLLRFLGSFICFRIE